MATTPPTTNSNVLLPPNSRIQIADESGFPTTPYMQFSTQLHAAVIELQAQVKKLQTP